MNFNLQNKTYDYKQFRPKDDEYYDLHTKMIIQKLHILRKINSSLINSATINKVCIIMFSKS